MSQICYKLLPSALILAVLGSCQRVWEDDSFASRGKEVAFVVSSENEPATRTTFSGEKLPDDESGLIERIDWIEGDRIQVLSTNDGTHYSSAVNYSVATVNKSPDGKRSYAGIRPESQGIQWSPGMNTFYGFYPAPATALTSNVVSGTIPKSITGVVATQRPDGGYECAANLAEYGYMYAVEEQEMEDGESVNLSFRSLFTAFEFELTKSPDVPETETITKVTLSTSGDGAFLAGDFSAKLLPGGGGPIVTVPGGTKNSDNVVITFSTGVALSESAPFRITILGLPVRLTNLSLTLTFKSGQSRTLDLRDGTGEPIVVAPGKKLYVKNAVVPKQPWYYLNSLAEGSTVYGGGTIPIGSKFKSYRQTATTMVAVPFVLEFCESEDGTWSQTPPAWLYADSANSYAGSTTGTSLILRTTDVEGDLDHLLYIDSNPDNEHVRNLYHASGVNDVVDLSTINVATGIVSDAAHRSTANCYVVQAPGTYSFPLVYGNGLKDGEENVSAYSYSGSSTNNMMTSFVDHLNTAITSPFIATQQVGKELTAMLLWTDMPGLVTDVDIDVNGEDSRITFTVPQEHIGPGNALIGVLADGRVAWSWHIWVTDADLTAYKTMGGYNFSTVNVGWCDGLKIDWPAYTCLVRVRQTPEDHPEGARISDPITITKMGKTVTFGGNSPYYQYGRKDPLQASDGGSNNYKTYYSAPGYAPASGSNSNKKVSDAIAAPYMFYKGSSSSLPWCPGSPNYLNLWNVDLSDNPTKSVYDPSPVGFKVPPRAAWSMLNQTVFPEESVDGISGRINSDTELFFPAAGARSYSSGDPVFVGQRGYYISADAKDKSYAYALLFYVGTGTVTPQSSGYRSIGYNVRSIQE